MDICENCGCDKSLTNDKTCPICGDMSESSKAVHSTGNGPLTPDQRVDRLFDDNPFPTYEEIEKIIWDAEFDTLNWYGTIAKRHGLRVCPGR